MSRKLKAKLLIYLCVGVGLGPPACLSVSGGHRQAGGPGPHPHTIYRLDHARVWMCVQLRCTHIRTCVWT